MTTMERDRVGPEAGAALDLGGYMEAGLVGHAALVERLLIALLTGGHVLIVGAPGPGKTRSVRRLADGFEGDFARIQCTPDLMPADVTGAQIFRSGREEMAFLPGPVFHEVALVDEINRAPPKVQSALLEAMAERQVTTGGVTRLLPEPFMVVATLNALESEGTFPLPEAQLDRFLMHVMLELPGAEHEMEILDLVEREVTRDEEPAPSVLSRAALAAMKADVARIHLSQALRDYIVRLVTATRGPGGGSGPPEGIRHGVSPRRLTAAHMGRVDAISRL